MRVAEPQWTSIEQSACFTGSVMTSEACLRTRTRVCLTSPAGETGSSAAFCAGLSLGCAAPQRDTTSST
eukprot:6205806-Pleurochrysis_carterae.AAC.1